MRIVCAVRAFFSEGMCWGSLLLESGYSCILASGVRWAVRSSDGETSTASYRDCMSAFAREGGRARPLTVL